MTSRIPPAWIVAGLLGFGRLGGVVAAGIEEPIRVLKSVGAEGLGNAAARDAWREATAPGFSAVPALLEAMSGANDYALNWLRLAVDAAVQKGRDAGAAWPKERLEAVLRDTRNHPKARHLAFTLLRRADPESAARLLDGFIGDPAPDLRREAVDARVQAATELLAKDKAAGVQALNAALGHAREADQIEAIAKQLKDLGSPADLRRVFGWVTRWKVIGPFDNTGGAGFTKVEPPEEKLDPAADLEGKKGRVRWMDYESRGDYGVVDLNAALGTVKGAAGYAMAEIKVPAARTAQIRLGSELGWKVWLNGKYLFGRDEYHRGAEIDQYRLPVELKPGTNVILVKCLQNEQTEDWAVDWQFQLRVTDVEGNPIHSEP
jgi:hypothetical protein